MEIKDHKNNKAEDFPCDHLIVGDNNYQDCRIGDKKDCTRCGCYTTEIQDEVARFHNGS